jgi:hypothetical protein
MYYNVPPHAPAPYTDYITLDPLQINARFRRFSLPHLYPYNTNICSLSLTIFHISSITIYPHYSIFFFNLYNSYAFSTKLIYTLFFYLPKDHVCFLSFFSTYIFAIP